MHSRNNDTSLVDALSETVTDAKERLNAAAVLLKRHGVDVEFSSGAEPEPLQVTFVDRRTRNMGG